VYSHEYDSQSGEWYPVSDLNDSYWPAVAGRKMPVWFEDTIKISTLKDGRLREAMTDLYAALDADLYVYAAVGLRGCFEIAAECLGVEDQSFQNKLNKLLSTGSILPDDYDSLKVLIEAGHAAVHRGFRPDRPDIEAVTDVLESFIFNAFISPYRSMRAKEQAETIASKVPPKRRPKSTLGGKK
jgi:hypothetical protein